MHQNSRSLAIVLSFNRPGGLMADFVHTCAYLWLILLTSS
ncbi:hypothetical protein NRB56_01450 [Nocardia sp. RB56]|uniref:Uncharacterized protein n=1 Tax=Nocardia aurantia TaxID=2585199 RepID=A0A7K0DG32_9NOCA|nr:hypothetical protein [Nocardia aurantia]